jgi:uncharacterized protein (DUF433 family)
MSFWAKRLGVTGNAIAYQLKLGKSFDEVLEHFLDLAH